MAALDHKGRKPLKSHPGVSMNCFSRKKRFAVAAVARLLAALAGLATVAALDTGCTCVAISNHEWAGHYPPKISRPEDIAENLRRSVNGRIKFSGSAGYFTIQFKRIGIFGWRDLGYDGEITGKVKQTIKNSDQFYTVDMKLETFQINGKNMPLTGGRYLRAEVCLCEVKLAENDLPKAGEKVWMRGRMVWDGDGFVEIHPRNAAEVKRLSSQ